MEQINKFQNVKPFSCDIQFSSALMSMNKGPKCSLSFTSHGLRRKLEPFPILRCDVLDQELFYRNLSGKEGAGVTKREILDPHSGARINLKLGIW
jgi:hypothetical protein